MVGGSKTKEMQVTASLMVEAAEKQGVYFAFALFLDSNRHDTDDIRELLELIRNVKGSIKNTKDTLSRYN